MITYFLYKIFHIFDKHLRMIRVGAIGRIGQPEILPNYNAIFIARVKEFIIAYLAYPITNHGKIHFFVVANRNIIFAPTVTKHVFAETPVAAKRNKPFSIYIHS